MSQTASLTRHFVEIGAIALGEAKEAVVRGDKITVRAHPLKDGSLGGQLLSIVLPNGETLGE